jgi:hypothetical protein
MAVAFDPPVGSSAGSTSVPAPDVLGFAARDALAGFVAAGLVPEIEGKGVVREQFPAPGELLDPGGRARLVLGEPSPAKPEDGTKPPRDAVRVAGLHS